MVHMVTKVPRERKGSKGNKLSLLVTATEGLIKVTKI